MTKSKHPKQRAEDKPKLKAYRHLTVMPTIADVDKDAYERAIAWLRANGYPAEVKRLDEILAKEGLEAAGRNAAYHAQYATLGLKPWQCPPMDANTTDLDDTSDCYGWRSPEVTLRARLEAAGLSIYEPDPAAALRARGRRAS
jgi:hypothetical protein